VTQTFLNTQKILRVNNFIFSRIADRAELLLAVFMKLPRITLFLGCNYRTVSFSMIERTMFICMFLFLGAFSYHIERDFNVRIAETSIITSVATCLYYVCGEFKQSLTNTVFCGNISILFRFLF